LCGRSYSFGSWADVLHLERNHRGCLANVRGRGHKRDH
jgi:hypothetical protein